MMNNDEWVRGSENAHNCTKLHILKKRGSLRIVEYVCIVYVVKYLHGYSIDKGGAICVKKIN
jgi:hypothetical protein